MCGPSLVLTDCRSHAGHDHLVDDVNDAIVGLDVGGHDTRIVDHDAVIEIHLDLRALDGLSSSDDEDDMD